MPNSVGLPGWNVSVRDLSRIGCRIVPCKYDNLPLGNNGASRPQVPRYRTTHAGEKGGPRLTWGPCGHAREWGAARGDAALGPSAFRPRGAARGGAKGAVDVGEEVAIREFPITKTRRHPTYRTNIVRCLK
jgi:hypothetical protein